MSVFRAGYDTTITVAPQSGEGASSDPTHGTQVEVDCKRETVRSRESTGDGMQVDAMDKLITAEREFSKTDFIWLPGTDTSKPKEAISPQEVGSDSMAGQSLHWAVL